MTIPMPMPLISRDEFERLYDTVVKGFDGLNERLDTLNGRTRKVEESTAVMWSLWGIVGAVAAATLGVILHGF